MKNNGTELEHNFATALRKSNIPEIKRYLEQGASPQFSSILITPVPFVPVQESCLEALMLLVEYGADLFCRDEHKYNLLHEAIEGLNFTYADKLQGYKVDETIADYLAWIKYLLDQGLSLYDEDKLGNTPLDSIVESEELMLPFLEPYLKKETNR